MYAVSAAHFCLVLQGRRTSAVVQGASDVKSRLANAILSGTGTAREKLIERRRQQQQLQNRGGWFVLAFRPVVLAVNFMYNKHTLEITVFCKYNPRR